MIPWEFPLPGAQGCENKAFTALMIELARKRAFVIFSAVRNSSMFYFNI
jgi:hypothetical protein